MFDRARFFAVPRNAIDESRVWLDPFLEEFERISGLVSAEDVISQAKSADAQLWSYYDGIRFRGVVITRIHTLVRGKLCSLWGCVGVDATEIMDGVLAEIEAWARSIGCVALEISGRAGWQRKLPGFVRKAVLLEKSLR